MKFGKHLQKRQLEIPEYAASFVNYKALKKLIKQLSATPVLNAQNATVDTQTALQANKATFFFRLERELEKVNAFYLQKEAELKLRLKTLLDKKKVMQSKNTTAKKSASFITLEEGFQQFANDLSKLEQFIEVNATAFSKILKKWDKTSKSRTKELYLSRAVEVQPCFNREVISRLSDEATTSLLELGAWAEGVNIQFESGKLAGNVILEQTVGTDENDADAQLQHAALSSNLVLLGEWTSRLVNAPDAKARLTRAFLAVISEAPVEALNLLLATGVVDLHAEDEINERNCLHEAAIAGRDEVLQIGLAAGVDVSRVDVYGRLPLHYACTHGRVAMIDKLLQAGPTTVDTFDHDNFTPLIHGIVHGQLSAVEQLLVHGARIESQGENDHVPLNLACQYGVTPIVSLLLQRQAKLLPDAEGLYPQHLVARGGKSPELLLLLKQHNADLDQRDKLYQWTPLFHAASEGNVAGVKMLLEQGVDFEILDEKNLSAMYYAAWEGHLDCMELLSTAATTRQSQRQASRQARSSQSISMAPEAKKVDVDGIPDLSLPPPILPLRRYGHNYLDRKAFIQMTFDTAAPNAVLFYNDTKYPASRLTISSKTSDLIPRNVMLPIQEDFRTISFQVDALASFTIDLEVFPTFGSKVIAKTVALPNIFAALTSSCGTACLPLFDPRLRPIGQLSFAFQVIKPFSGIFLDPTQFETYWKATSQLDSASSTLITGSSLSGTYLQLFVQLTSDMVPVIYPRYTISHEGIECSIARLTSQEFLTTIPRGKGQPVFTPELLASQDSTSMASLHDFFAGAFVTLEDALKFLPPSVNVGLHVLYPSAEEERTLGLGPALNINNYADSILTIVFDHVRNSRLQSPDFIRSIMLSSYNADICIALNWKQPNYPVLLCNDLGSLKSVDAVDQRLAASGSRSTSVKEAVRIAQTNNFMGLICSSRLLKMVPTLVSSIREAGLVLVTDTSSEPPEERPREDFDKPEGVDGILKRDGSLRFNQSVDM